MSSIVTVLLCILTSSRWDCLLFYILVSIWFCQCPGHFNWCVLASHCFNLRCNEEKWRRKMEKEMATHSSVLAWRIPGTEEPSGLPSMGSHRVGHDWRDLAAAASHCFNLQFSDDIWCEVAFRMVKLPSVYLLCLNLFLIGEKLLYRVCWFPGHVYNFCWGVC